ncbi:Las1-like-domain-containing protein [Microdochium trichocladiopsis]|uniref:Las1-like-domain-containing protein n=1 Tax=Microdochium trichocladiopsis TaxID=1682393 RepID=A0A9P9BRT8_9PEZI|nr:Las1-like-domain-containing protein [Microdochium trichocladiopsis]KAH7033281.1 Las1-like-domain-containing protein [Microdochium trichocladiopsis]
MVQYIVTPWRDHNELITARTQLYPGGGPPSDDTPDNLPWAAVYASSATRPTDQQRSEDDGLSSAVSRVEADQRLAVGRVQMWAHRGNCPHLVESTGLLVAVVLDDVDQSRRRRQQQRERLAASAQASSLSLSDFAVRAAYATAFSRFVTGLLDSQQDKQKKQSMYSLAKTIGLPATFVELRHQATHEQLPSLLKLRSAAKKALSWIWDFYWKGLPPADPSRGEMLQDGDRVGFPLLAGVTAGGDSRDEGSAELQLGTVLPVMSCEQVLLAYLQGKLDEATARHQLAQYDAAFIVKTTDDIGNSTKDIRTMTRALRLVGDMIEGTCPLITNRPPTSAGDASSSLGGEAARGGQQQQQQRSRGWVRRSKESWKPKPIGTV